MLDHELLGVLLIRSLRPHPGAGRMDDLLDLKLSIIIYVFLIVYVLLEYLVVLGLSIVVVRHRA